MTMRTCPDCDGYGSVATPTGDTLCPTCEGSCVVPAERHCAICGEPEGSDYAKPCCRSEQMLTV